MNVSILGTGAYGIALAMMFQKNNCNIEMWTPFDDEREELDSNRENAKALPGVKIPNSIKFTCDMKKVIEDSNLIVIAVPIAFFNETLKEVAKYVTLNQHFLIATKGIEEESGLFPSSILTSYINTSNYAVISGPSFAIDMANMALTALTLATRSIETESVVKKTLGNSNLVFSVTRDVEGTIVCGAIKNVVAIATGIMVGMNESESTQAMVLTNAIKEISNLIVHLGGDRETVIEYAGVGDLIMTSTSVKSRNFQLGVMIGKGLERSEIDKYISSTTVGGVYNLKSIYKLIKNKNIDVPLIDIMYDIVVLHKEPNKIFDLVLINR